MIPDKLNDQTRQIPRLERFPDLIHPVSTFRLFYIQTFQAPILLHRQFHNSHHLPCRYTHVLILPLGSSLITNAFDLEMVVIKRLLFTKDYRIVRLIGVHAYRLIGRRTSSQNPRLLPIPAYYPDPLITNQVR